MGKKILLFFLVGLCVWNLTKVPYYLAFDSMDSWVQQGIEGSINLGHGVDGYHGTKLKTPAINFLLLHNVIGITVLLMMALPVLRAPLRRRWGPVFFPFAIILGVHTLPAAWMIESPLRKYIFTVTCLYVIGAAIFGLVVLSRYERFQPSSEKYLLICYSLVTFGAYGAGFAEFLQIGKNIAARMKDAVWPDFGSIPHPMAGQTPYDLVPAAVGLVVFVLWIVLVWIALPIWWRRRVVGGERG